RGLGIATLAVAVLAARGIDAQPPVLRDLWKRTRRLRMAATVATVVLPNFVPILARAYTAEASTPWTSPLPADLNRPTRLITNHRLSQLGQAAAGVAALDNCYGWHLRATTDPTPLQR